jgi:hypothetical protein
MSKTQIVTTDIQDALEVDCVIFAGLDKKGRWKKLSELVFPNGEALTTEAVTLDGVVYPVGTLIDTILNQIDSITIGGGASLEITKLAGESISSQMVVILDTDNKIYKYDITDPSHYGKCIGISKTAASINTNITVSLVGSEITSAGSGWLVGETYFVSATSLLTVTPPTTGILKRIALGTATDRVQIVNYEERILL